MSADRLLVQITNCPAFSSSRPGEPCSRIVAEQAGPARERHVPEPWNGELETARLLFVSSNPAIDSAEEYPTLLWPPSQRVDFFRHRFGGAERAWTEQFRTLMKDGSHNARVAGQSYWNEIHSRAIELLGPGTEPGVDYAITEVVHCKSGNRRGVPQARDYCTSRYLEPLLEASGAKVIVLVGKDPWEVFFARYGAPPRHGAQRGISVGGKERMLISIGGVGSAEPRKFEKCLTPSELDYAKRVLALGHSVQ